MKVFKNSKLVYVIINGIKYIISNNKPIAPPENIPVSSVSVTNKITQLTQNLTHQLNVNILPSNATNKSLTYTSSNTSIATVSNIGLITAKTTGSCTITVKSNNNITDTMNLTVSSATISVSGVSLNKNSLTLTNGATEQLAATVLPSNATNKNVVWNSSNTSIATVSNGLVTSKSVGSATITVTTVDGNKTDTCNLTIEDVDNTIKMVTVTPQSHTIKPGESVQLKADVLPSTANQSVTWSSFNEGFATVSQTGLVTGVHEGLVEIYARSVESSSIYGACYINVSTNENNEESKATESTTPYIAHYVRDNTITIDEDYVLEYYVSDKKQTEYMIGKDTYIDVAITVDGVSKFSGNVKCGDNTVNLGKYPIGEHEVILIANESGIKSPQQIVKFRVVDSLTHTITESQTYRMVTSDLNHYGIDNTGNDINKNSTREGIQRMWDEKKSAGFRKCVMLPGVYIVEETTSLLIPDRFTVDLNNSTIKLAYSLLDKLFVVVMDNVYDSHMINGTICGDLQERISNGTLNSTELKGEHVGAFMFVGESNYCSVDNVIITQFPGYACKTDVKWKTGIETHAHDIMKLSYFEIGKDVINGVVVNNANKTSMTTMFDITRYKTKGYLSINKFLGFQGFLGDDSIITVHYYDINQSFIKTDFVRQYRKTRIPTNAKYIRFTFSMKEIPGYGDGINSAIFITDFKIPTNCAYRNIKGIDNGTCVLAPCACKDLIVEGCEYTRCGSRITAGPVDFEDGWEMAQDIGYYNNTTIERAVGQSFDLIFCAGQNIIIENNGVTDVRLRDRVLGAVVRNNNSLTMCDIGQVKPIYSQYTRCYNNTMNSYSNIYMVQQKNYSVFQVIRNCVIKESIGALEHEENIKFIGCTFTKTFTNCQAVNVLFSNDVAINSTKLENCIIKDATPILIKIEMVGGVVENSNIFYTSNTNYLTFDNVSWKDSCINSKAYAHGGKFLTMRNCTIENNNLVPFNYYIDSCSPILQNNVFNLGNAGLFNYIHPVRPNNTNNISDIIDNTINTTANYIISANLNYIEASDTGTYTVNFTGNTITNNNNIINIPASAANKIFVNIR